MLEQIAIGLVAGILFGLFGYVTKAYDPDQGYESFSIKKASRTTLVYGAAGAIVGYGGDPITAGAIEAELTTTIVLGEIFDKMWSRFISGRFDLGSPSPA